MPNLKRKGHKHSSGYVRSRTKRFQGNQFTVEQDTSYASTSFEKLKDVDEICINPGSYYVILNFLNVFNYLSTIVKCKECNSDVNFTRTNERGLGFKLNITCQCSSRRVESCPLINQAYEVNCRIMYVMRLLGLGLQGVNLFCGMMDLSVGFGNSTYYAFLQNLHTASKAVFEAVRQKSVKEEIKKNAEMSNESTHLSVSGDGSWKKRGFSSLFGITSLIGTYSKKVIDVVIKSSFCQGCSLKKGVKDTPEYEEWIENHRESCTVNHSGSAGKMEVDAVQEMFSRSEELFGVKYKYYIGDGDTKTFKALLDMDPYSDLKVEKKECVGHVEKRMGTRLRAAKKGNKGISGKGPGKLTDKLIKDLTIYYGLAIRKHPNSVKNMKKAVWATFLHKCSTDNNPQHENCPEGSDSWCNWRVAEATDELRNFKHDPPLADNVQTVIQPIYKALSDENLLQRCLGGNTQNSNESLNACVWKLAPKHLHCGAKTVEIATYLAVCVFNEGYTSILKVMNILGINIGLQANNFAVNANSRRIMHAERHVSSATREAIRQRKTQQMQQQKFFEEEEGLLYGPGIAD